MAQAWSRAMHAVPRADQDVLSHHQVLPPWCRSRRLNRSSCSLAQRRRCRSVTAQLSADSIAPVSRQYRCNHQPAICVYSCVYFACIFASAPGWEPSRLTARVTPERLPAQTIKKARDIYAEQRGGSGGGDNDASGRPARSYCASTHQQAAAKTRLDPGGRRRTRGPGSAAIWTAWGRSKAKDCDSDG